MTAPYLFHEEDAHRTLSDYFQKRANVTAFSRFIGARAQDFEFYVWDVIYGRVLLGDVIVNVPVVDTYDVTSENTVEETVATDAEGVGLEQLGAVVGATRDGADDVGFRQAIRLRIRTNRSFGRTQDVLDVALLAVPEGTAVKYMEGTPGRFSVWIRACPAPEQVWRAVARARTGGMYGHLIYTLPEWTDAEVLYFTSRVGGATTRGVLSSRHGATDPGFAAASQEA